MRLGLLLRANGEQSRIVEISGDNSSSLPSRVRDDLAVGGAMKAQSGGVDGIMSEIGKPAKAGESGMSTKNFTLPAAKAAAR